MPSSTQTMAATPRVFVPETPNKKIVPSLLVVDNVNGLGNAVITVQDRFTPSVTNGVAVPVATLQTRLQVNVSIGACVSLQDELRDIKILGQLEAAIGGADPGCSVTVAWDYE